MDYYQQSQQPNQPAYGQPPYGHNDPQGAKYPSPGAYNGAPTAAQYASSHTLPSQTEASLNDVPLHGSPAKPHSDIASQINNLSLQNQNILASGNQYYQQTSPQPLAQQHPPPPQQQPHQPPHPLQPPSINQPQAQQQYQQYASPNDNSNTPVYSPQYAPPPNSAYDTSSAAQNAYLSK